MITITLDEFLTKLRSQNVPREHLAFVCPICGSIQSAFDLIKAGAGKDYEEVEKYLAFSCVGRFTHKLPASKPYGTRYGCDWTLGGLFQFHDLEVITPDGKAHPRFRPVSATIAQAHMKLCATFLDLKTAPESDYA